MTWDSAVQQTKSYKRYMLMESRCRKCRSAGNFYKQNFETP